MHRIECTPPPDKAVTPAVVAPVAAGRGECTRQNRHQFRRSPVHFFSRYRIRSSLIAIAATIANTTQAALPIADNSQSASLAASCTSVPPSFWSDFASAFAWGLLGLVAPALLIVLTIFYGLILPRLKAYFDRRYQVAADFQETRQ